MDIFYAVGVGERKEDEVLYDYKGMKCNFSKTAISLKNSTKR